MATDHSEFLRYLTRTLSWFAQKLNKLIKEFFHRGSCEMSTSALTFFFFFLIMAPSLLLLRRLRPQKEEKKMHNFR